MKLKNKKTGKVVKVNNFNGFVHLDDETKIYSSLAELNEEWEDYEEPKVYYYISDFGAIREGDVGKFVEDEIVRKEIGNYFETKEEAEKAVEKLKAWKRLKENKVHFDLATLSDENVITIFARKKGEIHKYDKELDLLFGGEDE